MTAAFPKGPLWAKPERVARDIARALEHRSALCYAPPFWGPLMFVITHLPRALFHRSKL